MARRPRMYLAGVPAHVIHRGNDRQDCFYGDVDREVYRSLLADGLRRHGVALHAYVLMTNHVHLLLTPFTDDGVSRTMQLTAGSYVRYFNDRHGRTGTLWEGRHRASLVQSDGHLLACYRYIERNPVAAGMVSDPSEYRWSSYRHNALGATDPLITPHGLYLELGRDVASRLAEYRRSFERPWPCDPGAIRQAVQRNFPLGESWFRDEIGRQLGRSVGRALPGRPRGRSGSAP